MARPAGRKGIMRPSEVFPTGSQTSATVPGQRPDTKVENPATGQPAVTNSDTVDNAVTGYADKALDKYNEQYNKAGQNIRDLEQEQHNTDPEYLNKWQNVNFAEGDEGPYARGNRRTYEQTLELSRQADAYNNKPTEQVRDWRPGGSTAIGSVSYVDPYNRPKIETEEMREMQKSRQLDLNQKQLAQALQAAVNQKDLDAFRQKFQQLYNINLTRYQADLAMQTFAYQQLANQVVFKDRTIFNILAEFWNLGMKAQRIWQISQEDPGLAAIFTVLAVGQNVFGPEDIGMYQYAKQLMSQGYGIAEACQEAYKYYYNTMGGDAVRNTGTAYENDRKAKYRQ